jgi:ankyrin repeat protein
MVDWYQGMTTRPAAEGVDKILSELSPEQAEAVRKAMKPAVPEMSREQLLDKIREEAARGVFDLWAKEILSGKLEIDFKDTNGFTLMHLAVWRNEQALVTKLLDTAGCPVDIRSATDQTPLMFAVARGNLQLVKLFLDRGADIDARQSDKMTPVLLAAQSRQMNAYLVLQSRGVDIASKDTKGCGVAHWAAFGNDVQFLRLLKAMNMSLEEKDATGQTPLHRAAMANAYPAVKYLLSQGCDANAVDNEKRTPRDIARFYHSDAAMRALKQEDGPGVIEQHFTLAIGLYWLTIVWTYYSIIAPFTGDYLLCSLAFFVLSVTSPVLYILLMCSSAGRIPRQSDSITSSAVHQVSELFEEGRFSDIPRSEQFCLTCHCLRPQRSKHCSICDYCVPKQDLHCIGIGKCVGAGNRGRYVLWLWGLHGLVLLHAWLSWGYLHTFVQETTFTGYSAVLVLKAMDAPLLLQATILIDLATLWYLGGYLFLMLYSISNALTANEVLNRHKYRYLYAPYQAIDGSLKLRFKNPFFRSYMTSWTEFLVGSIA